MSQAKLAWSLLCSSGLSDDRVQGTLCRSLHTSVGGRSSFLSQPQNVRAMGVTQNYSLPRGFLPGWLHGDTPRGFLFSAHITLIRGVCPCWLQEVWLLTSVSVTCSEVW